MSKEAAGDQRSAFSAEDARAEIARALSFEGLDQETVLKNLPLCVQLGQNNLLAVIATCLVELVEAQRVPPDYAVCGVCGLRFNRSLCKICPHCHPWGRLDA